MSIDILPAIDLINGKCVRLQKGQFDKVTKYNVSPSEVAQQYERAGAEFIHIVDLDGAKAGVLQQLNTLKIVRKACHMTMQVGGGVNSMQQVNQLFEIGTSRVVIGSLTVKDPVLARDILIHYGGEKIVFALDVFVEEGTPFIAANGWQSSSHCQLDDVIRNFSPYGLKHVLCTDIQRDGMLQGPNVQLYKNYQQRYPQLRFQASGGVGSLGDISALKKANIPGVIIGKALYEKKFTLGEALAC